MSEQLHPHWRIQYIRTRKEPGAGSPFAALLAANDDETNLILHRGAHCFVILNNSPYNPGHLMVLPNRILPQSSPRHSRCHPAILTLHRLPR